MKINITYLDNLIELCDDKIFCLEILNKRYIYRIINDFITLNDENNDNVKIIVDGDIKTNIKQNILFDYFNINFEEKKIQNVLFQKIDELMDEKEKDKINAIYNKLINIYKKVLNNFDYDVGYKNEYSIDNISKMMGIYIKKKNSILNNLMTLIEIEKEFKINDLIIFVDLKKYLSSEEVIELYKYIIYNNIKVIFIELSEYKLISKYEKKTNNI